MTEKTATRKVKFVSPAKLYQTIKTEIDAAYFDVVKERLGL